MYNKELKRFVNHDQTLFYRNRKLTLEKQTHEPNMICSWNIRNEASFLSDSILTPCGPQGELQRDVTDHPILSDESIANESVRYEGSLQGKWICVEHCLGVNHYFSFSSCYKLQMWKPKHYTSSSSFMMIKQMLYSCHFFHIFLSLWVLQYVLKLVQILPKYTDHSINSLNLLNLSAIHCVFHRSLFDSVNLLFISKICSSVLHRSVSDSVKLWIKSKDSSLSCSQISVWFSESLDQVWDSSLSCLQISIWQYLKSENGSSLVHESVSDSVNLLILTDIHSSPLLVMAQHLTQWIFQSWSKIHSYIIVHRLVFDTLIKTHSSSNLIHSFVNDSVNLSNSLSESSNHDHDSLLSCSVEHLKKYFRWINNPLKTL